jgi:serine/threonine protein kinase
MIGQILNNRYKITERLGKGAMGTVYKATDLQSAQVVAVKVIASDLAVDPSMLERFRREGETLRQLRHLNIVGFVDAFQHDDHYVIIMEYVSGGSLFEALKSGPMSIERAVQISLDLCDALIRSHKIKIIHRDIKPENVLIDEDGTPKLADFGVARLSEGTRMTRSGMQVGTPYYMAPEAWDGKVLDAQADIWSLGVMLFEMLSGQLPFVGDTPMSVMNKVNNTPPPDLRKLRADVPPSLVRIISKMLTKNKNRRYQTMREVAVDLERYQQTQGKPVKSVRPQFSFNWLQGISGIWNKVANPVTNLIKPIFKKEETTTLPSKGKWHPRLWWYVLGFIAVIALILSIFVSNARANDIYYTKLVDGKTEIYQYKDGQNILILGSNGTEEYWHPAPDINGNLYFSSTTSDGQVEIFRYNTDRVKEQFTTQTPKPFSSWNPVPDMLGNLYFSSDQKEDKTEIYVIDINGIKHRVTFTKGDFESWSPAPDGLGNLYFVSNRYGDVEIFVLDAKNKAVSRVVGEYDDFAYWSPVTDIAGNLYFVSNRDGNTDIFVLDENRRPKPALNKSGAFSNWSPLPDKFGNLYFISDRNGKPQIFMLSKGKIQVLEDIPANSWLQERFPVPSTPENTQQ